jgi:hypothetical protein
MLKKNKTLADGSPIHFPRIPSYGLANPRIKPRNDFRHPRVLLLVPTPPGEWYQRPATIVLPDQDQMNRCLPY